MLHFCIYFYAIIFLKQLAYEKLRNDSKVRNVLSINRKVSLFNLNGKVGIESSVDKRIVAKLILKF